MSVGAGTGGGTPGDAMLRALLGLDGGASPFPSTSRYHGTPLATLTLPDGRVVAFVRRRFLPAAGRLESFGAHRVEQGDRPDLLASTYLGDPQQFWQLCDINGVMDPDELTATVGRLVRIGTSRASGALNGSSPAGGGNA